MKQKQFKTMNKKTLLFVFTLLLMGGSSFAQIEIEQDSFAEIGADYDASWIEIKFHVVNNSPAGDTSFYWKVTTDNANDYGYAICDLNLCYPEDWDSADFNMPVGLDTTFSVYFYPNGFADGQAGLTIEIISRNNSANTATAYFFNTTRKTGISSIENLALSVVPNPAQNVISLSTNMPSAYQVEIYDMTGQLILKLEENYDNSSIDISALKPGMYFIKATGDQVYSGSIIKQ